MLITRDERRHVDLIFRAPLTRMQEHEEGERAGQMEIEGYGATHSFQGDGILVPRSVWDAAIERGGGSYALTATHEMSSLREVVGRTVSVGTDEIGTRIRGFISASEPAVQTKLREGLIDAFSVGAQVVRGHWNEELELAEATEVEIYHYCLTAFPKDAASSIEVARTSVFADPADVRKLFGVAPTPAPEPVAVAAGVVVPEEDDPGPGLLRDLRVASARRQLALAGAVAFMGAAAGAVARCRKGGGQ